MSKFNISIVVIWVVCLVLNLGLFLDIFSYSGGIFASMFWFFMSILVLILIYTANISKFITGLLLIFVGFCGGYFTSYLYFGVADINALSMGILSAIIAVSLRFGVAVL
ncbi:hypothetical protein [Campylobacter corcagiensis]|uniref:Uncharacterized protein n=1 Tax=Campylobacter corcagiensis TaxID=1448857 RepID=A0A7M1LGD3_9BACT|nr:hypothetical protein [Campylobacter corcagiensis]QKF64443.1 putative membrane protein [Campylobacter corcagiensis]QOQ87371.1 hypothetical protein IMC76_00705 [Campylobacter corcagiensis]